IRGIFNAGTLGKGNAAGNTQKGVEISSFFPNTAGGNTIGGLTLEARNVISENAVSGILISDSPGNFVIGNFIGLAADGLTAAGNGIGVHVLVQVSHFWRWLSTCALMRNRRVVCRAAARRSSEK